MAPLNTEASDASGLRLGIVLIIAAFLWVYWPFLFVLRFSFVAPDSYVYYVIGREVVSGQLDTEWRTPLFPALVFLTMEYGRGFWLVAAQCVIFLVSVCFVFHSLLRKFDRWSFLPALAFALLTVSSQLVMKFNLFLLTESLFATCCLIYVGLLVRCYDRMRDKDLILLSLVSIVSFMIRNSGEIFLATNIVLVLFRRDSWPGIVRGLGIAVAPMAIAILVISANNYARGGFFRTTLLSIGARGYLTVPLWQPSAQFPEKINRLIASLSEQIDQADLATLRDTDDPGKIMEIQGKYNQLLRPVDAINKFLLEKDNEDLREQIKAETGYRTKLSLPLYVAGLASDRAAKISARLYYKLLAANFFHYCCRHFDRFNMMPANFLDEETKYMARTERLLAGYESANVFNAPTSEVCVEACVLSKSDEAWAEDLSRPAVLQTERTAAFMRQVELGPWGYVALTVSVIAGVGLLASGFRDKILYVIVVVASIYGPYLAGMGWTGVLYEGRLMTPMVPLNYFLSIIGGALLVYRAIFLANHVWRAKPAGH